MRIPHEAHEPSEALRLADRRMYAEKGRRSTPRPPDAQCADGVLREREPELGRPPPGGRELAVELGRRLRFPAEELDILGRAAELHDIGKMAIPDEILHKPGPLDDDEGQLMRSHTLVGERILARRPGVAAGRALVRSTPRALGRCRLPRRPRAGRDPARRADHRRLRRLRRDDLERTYKPKIDVGEAIAELRSNSGSQFDPMIVELLCEVIEEDREGAVRDGDEAIVESYRHPSFHERQRPRRPRGDDRRARRGPGRARYTPR